MMRVALQERQAMALKEILGQLRPEPVREPLQPP
jgi:hypothetical protein